MAAHLRGEYSLELETNLREVLANRRFQKEEGSTLHGPLFPALVENSHEAANNMLLLLFSINCNACYLLKRIFQLQDSFDI